MTLTQTAAKAAAEISGVIDPPLTADESEKVTAIIAEAMKTAVHEASALHADVCADCLRHDHDLAHKVREQIERKKIALIANLSSLR